MGVLDVLAGVSEVLLAIILLVATVLFAAVCGGLGFGLRFGRKKLTPGIAKANEYVAKGRRIELKALRYVAMPVIEAHAWGHAIAVAIAGVVDDARTRAGRP